MTLTSRVQHSRGAVVGVGDKDHVSGRGIVQGADNVEQRDKCVILCVPLHSACPIYTLCIEAAPHRRACQRLTSRATTAEHQNPKGVGDSLLVDLAVYNCVSAHAQARIRQEGAEVEVCRPVGSRQIEFLQNLLADIAAVADWLQCPVHNQLAVGLRAHIRLQPSKEDPSASMTMQEVNGVPQ